MSEISVDILLLSNKSSREKNNCLTINSIKNSLNGIKNSLAYKLQNSGNINTYFNNLDNKLSSIEENLLELSEFMKYSASEYNECEKHNLLLISQLIDGIENNQYCPIDPNFNNNPSYDYNYPTTNSGNHYITDDGMKGYSLGYAGGEKVVEGIGTVTLDNKLFGYESAYSSEGASASGEAYVLKGYNHLDANNFEIGAGITFLSVEAHGDGDTIGVDAGASFSVLTGELDFINHMDENVSSSHGLGIELVKGEAGIQIGKVDTELAFDTDLKFSLIEADLTPVELDIFGFKIGIDVSGSMGSIGGDFDMGLDVVEGHFNIGGSLAGGFGFGLNLRLDWSELLKK